MELDAERWRGRLKPFGSRVDLWDGVHPGRVPPPLDRSRWMGSLTLGELASRDHQNAFVARLLSLAASPAGDDVLDALQIPEHERRNLLRLPELVALCNAVGEPRHIDAFHFWTALCNDLEYFLTSDKRFLQSLREKGQPADMICRAVSAAELVDALSLARSPLPIGAGEVIDLFAADIPTEPEQSQRF
jgi:hypothetical protein